MNIPLHLLSFALLSCSSFKSVAYQQTSIVPIDQQYLAQTPPGNIPEVFARDILPDYLHTTPIFTQDLSQMYWVNKNKMYTTKYQHTKWSTSEIKLTEGDFSYDCPFIMPNGNKLFFIVLRKTIKGQSGKSENIWYSQRNGDKWKEPVPLGPNINQHHMHWQISVAGNGNLYFLTDYTQKSQLLMSEFVHGEYQDPINLGQNINDDNARQLGPYIAPDESYLLFSRAPDLGSSDELYISLKKNGGWTKASKILLADGSNIVGISPIVSPDGKYLFYMTWTNGEHRTHWVSTSQIDGLNRN